MKSLNKTFARFFCTLMVVALTFGTIATTTVVAQDYAVEILLSVMADEWYDVSGAEIAIYRDGVQVATVVTEGERDVFAPHVWYRSNILGTYTVRLVNIPPNAELGISAFQFDTGMVSPENLGGGLFMHRWYVTAATAPQPTPAPTPVPQPTPAPTPVPTPPLGTAQDIGVLIDGVPLVMDVPPVILSGRTLVPLRAISEALGADVAWESSTRMITISDGGMTAIMFVNNYAVTVIAANGTESTIQLDVSPTIIDGRTLVPLRFISELFGHNVDWDSVNRNAIITTQ